MKQLITLIILTLFLQSTVYAKKDYDLPQPLEFDEPQKISFGKKKAHQQFINNVKSCSFEITPLLDKRQNKVTIGHNFKYPLQVSEFDAFLKNVDQEIVQNRLELLNKGDKKIKLLPSLTRLYTYAQSMNIHGVSALKVDIYFGEEFIESKHYRGLSSSANWNNGVGEYHSAANEAIEENIIDLFSDFPKLCSEALKS